MAVGQPINVLFRVDASLQIGTGHVMRCLTLAAALRERGATCRFVCREHTGNMIDVVRQLGYDACVLPLPDHQDDRPRPDADHRASTTHVGWLGVDWRTDARQARAIAGETVVDWLVVDHYALDLRWERALRTQARHLMVIDDLADRLHDCDLLLDQNLGREASEYETLTPSGCELLIGPSNALLRPEFERSREHSLARRKHPKLGRLLISLGGVDKDNLTCRILGALRSSALPADCVITVVMGAMAPALSIVRQHAATMPWVTEVRIDVHDMAALMANSDLAIGAAGGTTWERCCMGLPTLLVVAAENQRKAATAMETSKAAWNLGEATREDFEQAVASAIDWFAHRPSALRRMSERASALTNGEGASRVAEMMLSVATPTRALHPRASTP